MLVRIEPPLFDFDHSVAVQAESLDQLKPRRRTRRLGNSGIVRHTRRMPRTASQCKWCPDSYQASLPPPLISGVQLCSSDMTSLRVRASERQMPRMAEVTMMLPGFLTPRQVMQVWVARAWPYREQGDGKSTDTRAYQAFCFPRKQRSQLLKLS